MDASTRISIVDDDALVRRALGRVCKLSGYAVELFASAEEFLDVTSYTNVVRWATEIKERPAFKRGQRVNKVWGPEEEQVRERHDASDLD